MTCTKTQKKYSGFGSDCVINKTETTEQKYVILSDVTKKINAESKPQVEWKSERVTYLM